MALLAIAVILAAETSPDLRRTTILRRLPAILLVLLVGMMPMSAQAVIVGLSLITALQAVVDVRNRRTVASVA